MVDKRVLLVTFGVGLVGLGLLSGGSVTSNYEHFDPMRIDNFKYIAEFCTLDTSEGASDGGALSDLGAQANRLIVCEDPAIAQEKKRIEQHLGELFDHIDNASPGKQYFYRREIKKLLPRLTRKASRIGIPNDKFTVTYTKFLLEDILLHFAYQDTVISVEVYDSEGEKKSPEQLRREIIPQLIDQGFQDFIQDPYQGSSLSGSQITTSTENWMDFTVQRPIQARDELDLYLEDSLALPQNKQTTQSGQYGQASQSGQTSQTDVTHTINIDPDRYSERGSLYLFKSTNDLKALGYEVVSHRIRDNYDESYRRFNIHTALDTIGSVRVILPGETISFLQGSQFDPQERERYQYGKVIFLDEEKYDYGGGLCGGSTALYQGIILNKGFDIQSRNHTKRYTNLYTATINGETITTPGLDSTIYSPNLDLQFTNSTDMPIILVNNYNGSFGGSEEVFTIGDPKNRGDVTYLSSYPATFTMQKSQQEIENERKALLEQQSASQDGLVSPISSTPSAQDGQVQDSQGSQDTQQTNTDQSDSATGGSTPSQPQPIEISPTKSIVGRCYIWNINGQETRRCYKEVF